jgi:hypothetical protein
MTTNQYEIWVTERERWRRSEDALSTTIKINHRQVFNIVVGDLIEKYKCNVEQAKRNVKDSVEWANRFEAVLRYYLDDEEMEKLIVEAEDYKVGE